MKLQFVTNFQNIESEKAFIYFYFFGVNLL